MTNRKNCNTIQIEYFFTKAKRTDIDKGSIIKPLWQCLSSVGLLNTRLEGFSFLLYLDNASVLRHGAELNKVSRIWSIFRCSLIVSLKTIQTYPQSTAKDKLYEFTIRWEYLVWLKPRIWQTDTRSKKPHLKIVKRRPV